MGGLVIVVLTTCRIPCSSQQRRIVFRPTTSAAKAASASDRVFGCPERGGVWTGRFPDGDRPHPGGADGTGGGFRVWQKVVADPASSANLSPCWQNLQPAASKQRNGQTTQVCADCGFTVLNWIYIEKQFMFLSVLSEDCPQRNKCVHQGSAIPFCRRSIPIPPKGQGPIPILQSA